jgi:hypothetical protein
MLVDQELVASQGFAPPVRSLIAPDYLDADRSRAAIRMPTATARRSLSAAI